MKRDYSERINKRHPIPTRAQDLPSEAGRCEIECILRRSGASAIEVSAWKGRAVVSFEMAGRQVRFDPMLPEPAHPQFTHTPAGRARAPAQREKARARACRECWHTLALVIQAKIAAVEAGKTAFEAEFMAQIA